MKHCVINCFQIKKMQKLSIYLDLKRYLLSKGMSNIYLNVTIEKS